MKISLRKILVCFTLAFLAFSHAACGTALTANSQSTPARLFAKPRSKIAKIPPTLSNVHYGKHARQVLDFWKAKSTQPTPVVVYIHGGGFVGGDKTKISPVVISECLKSGISVASINYRFVTEHPFPAPQLDGARAIQFLRYKSKDWNIDSNRIAAYGGSAGAGIAMFVAFHDDMADPAGSDPVARESSRLIAVGSFGGQSTYDPREIKKWIGGRAHEHPSIFKCYNIKGIDEIHKPTLQKLYDKVSAIKHVSKDDPPVFMFYSEPDVNLPSDTLPGRGIHHPRFGYELIRELDKVGVKSVYHHKSTFKGNIQLELTWFFRDIFSQQ